MSEQQKDRNVTGEVDTSAAGPLPAAVPEPIATDASGDAAKPKQRAAAKAKTTPHAGAESVKPKRTRTSSRSPQAKQDGVGASPSEGVQPATEQGQRSTSKSEPNGLPPLPSAPVPTPEGIAFMRQHIAYQTALDQRAEWRRDQLERSIKPAKEAVPPTSLGPGKSRANPDDAAIPVEGKRSDASGPGVAPAVNADSPKRSKPPRENSIEAGQDKRKEPVSESELKAVHDVDDRRLLRELLDRSRLLRERGNALASAEPAAAIAQSDTGTLHKMKDPAARKLGLAVAERNRHEVPEYKAEFDKLAPELKAEAQEANIGKPSAARTAGTASSRSDEPVTGVSTAVPDSVRRRFLKVDSEYYFPDRSPAFVDRGVRLATRGEHPEVVVALIEISKERGWNSVTVKGSEAFRRAAWMEAARNGMQVAGYKPTELDLAQLKQREPTNLIEPGVLREQAVASPRSPAKPADKSEERTLDDKLSAFANERPTLVVKKYPELVQAYSLLDAARKFAEAHMPGHEAQFIAIGKELIAQQIRAGKEVIGPKIHPDHIGPSRTAHPKAGKDAETRSRPEGPVQER
jgi:hypothetical protein